MVVDGTSRRGVAAPRRAADRAPIPTDELDAEAGRLARPRRSTRVSPQRPAGSVTGPPSGATPSPPPASTDPRRRSPRCLDVPAVVPSVEISPIRRGRGLRPPGRRAGHRPRRLAGRTGMERRPRRSSTDSARRCSSEVPDFSTETALVTGASPAGIAFEVVRRLLDGGATVVCTIVVAHAGPPRRLPRALPRPRRCPAPSCTSSPPTWRRSATSTTWSTGWSSPVVSNAGGVTRTLKRPMRPTLVLPFAAGSVEGELPDAGPDAEVAHAHAPVGRRAPDRPVGRVLGEDGRRADPAATWSCRRRPTTATFGGDGAYGEAKAALDAVVAKWSSERARWGRNITLARATIGWVRGTGLMDANDAAAALVEERLGLRTFSAAEMGWLVTALCLPEIRARAEQAPVEVDLRRRSRRARHPRRARPAPRRAHRAGADRPVVPAGRTADAVGRRRTTGRGRSIDPRPCRRRWC